MTVNVQIDQKDQVWVQTEAGRLGQTPSEYIAHLVVAREDEFRALADQWVEATSFSSSIPQMVMHPAYQRVIGLGHSAVPLILQELQTRPAHWFWALKAITGEDPAADSTSYDDGVSAWIDWGRQRGYIS